MKKEKRKAKISHLINWYFGNFCAKCGKIDSEEEDYGQKCLGKLNMIKDNLDVNEMTHKQFVNIVRNSSFCHPTTRKFCECELCKKHRISNKYWIKNWDGWNLRKRAIINEKI